MMMIDLPRNSDSDSDDDEHEFKMEKGFFLSCCHTIRTLYLLSDKTAGYLGLVYFKNCQFVMHSNAIWCNLNIVYIWECNVNHKITFLCGLYSY